MTPDVLGFWILAVTLVLSALMVVLSKNLFHSVLWLALGLVSTAGVFLLLDAEFLASVQVLLYAGGVITVVVFAIVVTEKLVGERLSAVSRRMAIGPAHAVAQGDWQGRHPSAHAGSDGGLHALDGHLAADAACRGV